jgi:ribosomal protein S18 acetylase RimI-like enzyme
MGEISIRAVNDAGSLLAATIAPEVFDDPLDENGAKRFFAGGEHHLVCAFDGETIVGFISAVRYFHPDKPRPELWLNEVGVSPEYQRKGVGARLMQATLALARARGCTEAWVLTDRGNVAARGLYAKAGGAWEEALIYAFKLD